MLQSTLVLQNCYKILCKNMIMYQDFWLTQQLLHVESTLVLENCYKFLCKHKIFLTGVYMIFKYGKRFRFAPSFNYSMYVHTANFTNTIFCTFTYVQLQKTIEKKKNNVIIFLRVPHTYIFIEERYLTRLHLGRL